MTRRHRFALLDAGLAVECAAAFDDHVICDRTAFHRTRRVLTRELRKDVVAAASQVWSRIDRHRSIAYVAADATDDEIALGTCRWIETLIGFSTAKQQSDPPGLHAVVSRTILTEDGPLEADGYLGVSVVDDAGRIVRRSGPGTSEPPLVYHLPIH